MVPCGRVFGNPLPTVSDCPSWHDFRMDELTPSAKHLPAFIKIRPNPASQLRRARRSWSPWPAYR
jgi:hypothetical protein